MYIRSQIISLDLTLVSLKDQNEILQEFAKK